MSGAEKAAAAPSGRGRKFKKSAKQSAIVKGLVEAKVSVIEIAKQLGIDKKTLNRHFRAELGKPGRRPAFVFTDQQRGEVRGLAMANVPIEQIAAFIGIAEGTLKKYFLPELSKGRLTLLAGAATNMARMALGSKAEYDAAGNMIREEVKPEFVACCYVLKTQGKDYGWSERLEHSGKDGGGIPIHLKDLTNAQLHELVPRLERAILSITDQSEA